MTSDEKKTGGKVIQFMPVPTDAGVDADAAARADTARRRALFEWADAVLKQVGLDRAVAAAASLEELRGIVLDTGNAEIILAIRDALQPARGRRVDHFGGLNGDALKHILKNRLDALKRDREAALRRGRRRTQPDWGDDLVLDDKGKIIANLANLILILCKSPKWRGVLAFDEFSACVVMRKSPPWDEAVSSDTPWTDHSKSLTRVWFETQRIRPSGGDVGRAVQAAARHNRHHPVREYFAALRWDGRVRLDSWLQDHLGVEDTAYARAIGPRYLISAVARIFKPGCQADHTLTLEGPQGILKSKALCVLAVRDEWFTDKVSHIGSKDACMEVAGVWFIELAEMDALTRATSSAIKAFLTRRSDRFRPPYGKHLVRLPRQCVFAGTINAPAGGYLRDPTGARRIWPVVCGTIDIAGLEAARDQLWSEAVHRFKAGDPWWLETPRLVALATAEQDARFVVDPWRAAVDAWLGERTETSVEEVLTQALGFPPKAWTQSAQTRAANILKSLGFSKCRPRVSGAREYRYRRDPEKR